MRGRIWTGVRAFALVVALAVPLGCGGDEGTDPSDGNRSSVTINMYDNYFTPEVDTISVNGTIRWTNQGSFDHTSTSSGGQSWNLVLGAGATDSVTVTQPGSYDYICTYHEGMVGTIVVE